MKHAVLAWVALVAIAMIASVDCSITHESDGFACTTTANCSKFPGRVCMNGFCVEPGGPGSDAGVTDGKGSNHPDASNCPANCTSCDLGSKTCFIDCDKTSCTNMVTCPPGFNCDIQCSTSGSCRNGVNCTQGQSCIVTCSGDSACRGVTCGSGPCDVECSGPSSCKTINCESSCRCDVNCFPGSLCEFVTCTQFQCRDQINGGCNSTLTGCDTCP